MSRTPGWKARRSARQARRARLASIASLGGKASAAKRAAAKLPLAPYAEPFLAFLDAVGRSGPTRATWRTFWKVADGIALDPDEVKVFQLHAGRTTPPTRPARECWVVGGRRSGKSEQIVTRATWRAISKDWKAVLSAGEKGIVPLVASDKAQAENTLAYLKGIAHHPLVAPHVLRSLKASVEFRSGAVVRVLTASWRSTRGYTMLDAVLEECAFYSSADSANPDEELLHAVRPALLTIPDARVYAISSPYSRKGILWQAYEKHWAKDRDDVLVWNGSTESFNPTVNAGEIERAFADDPAVAASEYGRDGLVSFRSDVEAFIPREVVEAVVIAGRRELPRISGVVYYAFCDPSGGTQDSMTLAIAHIERDGRVILDCVREMRAPFSTESAVREFAGVLKSYGLAKVTGDKYGGEWPTERFRVYGITYQAAEYSKSELYVELLPILNGARCELLDVPKLAAQLISLERRTGRGTGRDTVDHPTGGHDDLANAVAGVLTMVAGGKRGPRVIFSDGARRFDSWASEPRGIDPSWLPPPELDEHGN